MSTDVSNKVKKIVADHLGIEEAKVTETIADAVSDSDSTSSEADAELVNTGYSLPETISVLETVE